MRLAGERAERNLTEQTCVECSVTNFLPLPSGVLYQKVQHLLAGDELVEKNSFSYIKHQRPRPKGRNNGIPSEQWPTVIHRVVEQKESLRTVAAAYGVSHETIRPFCFMFRNSIDHKERSCALAVTMEAVCATGHQHATSVAQDELLCLVLCSEQYDQLVRNGYLDIESSSVPGCIYRVPRAQGLVKVIEQGRLKKSLCLQPQEMVPNADLIVMHKLMIEADEETYLQTANTFTPTTSSSWDD